MNTINDEDINLLIKAMRKHRKNGNACRRMLAVRLRGKGKTYKEIGAITDFHPEWVSKLVKVYCAQGISGLINDGRKGGNNRKLDAEEAEEFLSKFRKESEAGHISTVREIAREYDELTGKQRRSHSSVYYFLHSHKWRKVVPKHQHPDKASDEAIEASKKLTPR